MAKPKRSPSGLPVVPESGGTSAGRAAYLLGLELGKTPGFVVFKCHTVYDDLPALGVSQQHVTVQLTAYQAMQLRDRLRAGDSAIRDFDTLRRSL